MIIGHYYDGIYLNGGVSQYIQSISRLQLAAGHQIILFEGRKTTARGVALPTIVVADNDELFETSRALGVEILHLHGGLTRLPPMDIAVIYTVHQQSPHCMSGALYLKRRDLPCPRTHSFIGCLKGHIQDHCGSLRPLNVLSNFKKIRTLRKVLPEILVICVGRFLRDRMLRAGYPSKNLFLVSNFSDFPDIGPRAEDHGTPHFLFLGRLEKLKGVSWLLRSFKLMSSHAILDIAGQGTYETDLRKLAAELKLEQRVRFLGWADEAQKRELLLKARAIVVPSTWHEAFGLVTIEAAAQECPAIVSDAGELPFIVDHEKTGIVVPAGDYGALAAALDRLAGDARKARVMGMAAKTKCREEYSAATHLSRLDNLYRLAIDNGHGEQGKSDKERYIN